MKIYLSVNGERLKARKLVKRSWQPSREAVMRVWTRVLMGEWKERLLQKKRNTLGLAIDEMQGREGWINICDKQGNEFRNQNFKSLQKEKNQEWFENVSLRTEKRIISLKNTYVQRGNILKKQIHYIFITQRFRGMSLVLCWYFYNIKCSSTYGLLFYVLGVYITYLTKFICHVVFNHVDTTWAAKSDLDN